MKTLSFSMSYVSGKIRRRLNLKANNLQKKKPIDSMRIINSLKIEFENTQIWQIP